MGGGGVAVEHMVAVGKQLVERDAPDAKGYRWVLEAAGITAGTNDTSGVTSLFCSFPPPSESASSKLRLAHVRLSFTFLSLSCRIPVHIPVCTFLCAALMCARCPLHSSSALSPPHTGTRGVFTN